MQLDFSELNDYYFEISNIFSVEQLSGGKTKFIMQNPRPTDALLLFEDTVGICYQDNHFPLYVPQGSLVYLPQNSNYIWENSPAPGCAGQKNLLFEFSLRLINTYSGEKGELCRTASAGEHITFGDSVSIVTNRHALLYKGLFSKLISVFSKASHSPLPVFCEAYNILHTISNNCRIEKNSCVDISLIKDSIKYLEDTSCCKSIKQIADECNISIGYFERLFYGYCGMTPTEYRSMYKINYIKMLLQTENITLEDIAQKTGYCDSGYLCRIFKKKTGITPTEYRRMFIMQTQHKFRNKHTEG